MLSLMTASAWLCALSAEIADESAPERLIAKLPNDSGCDADNVGGRDGSISDQELQRAARKIDAGDGAGNRRGVVNRGSAGVGGSHAERILTAIVELRAVRPGSVPRKAVVTGGRRPAAGPHRIAR